MQQLQAAKMQQLAAQNEALMKAQAAQHTATTQQVARVAGTVDGIQATVDAAAESQVREASLVLE